MPLWSEQSSPENLDSIVWPRLAVAAEVFWTGETLPDGTSRLGANSLPLLVSNVDAHLGTTSYRAECYEWQKRARAPQRTAVQARRPRREGDRTPTQMVCIKARRMRPRLVEGEKGSSSRPQLRRIRSLCWMFTGS